MPYNVTPASASQLVTVDTDIYTIYNDLNGCTGILITVPSNSPGSLLVHVDGMHSGNPQSGDYYEIDPGESVPFRHMHLGIRLVTVQALTGICTFKWTVLAKSTTHG